MASHPNLVHVDDVAPIEVEQGPLRFARTKLGVAAGAQDAGLSLWRLPPGARSTPPHAHADEDEVAYVLRGTGLSWQDGTTYAIGAGDALMHLGNAEAHTLIAGEDGLDVLIFAEGSRTHLTFLPRTGQFWAGRRWIPADTPHPFAAEAALPALDVPPPDPERPATICAIADVPAESFEDRGYEGAERNAGRALGRRGVGLRHVALRPGAWSCPPHWHLAEEEAFYVLDGEGVGRLGDLELPLRPGSVLWRPPGTGVPHTVEAGPAGLEYLAFGTHRPDEVVHYPRSKKMLVGQTVVKVQEADYWEGELR